MFLPFINTPELRYHGFKIHTTHNTNGDLHSLISFLSLSRFLITHLYKLTPNTVSTGL